MGHFALRWVSLSVLLLSICSGTGTWAQEGTIRGQVVDRETRAPVVRANVVLERDTDQWGTSTDSSGAFRLRVPPGPYDLRVSVLGYRVERRDVEVQAAGVQRVHVELVPERYSLNEIVVQGQKGNRSASGTTIQRIEPGIIEQQDAAVVSELAPVVPATHVQTNSRGQTIWYFRNAGDRQVGQFFDGALLNIPWDNRVDISLIPASIIGEVTVTKGVPSVRYGANVLGGAVNFQSRTLSRAGQRTEIRGAIGTAADRRASVTHLGRTAQWDYTGALQYSSHGNQPLPNGVNLDNNQPNPNRRINTDRRLFSGFGRAAYRLSSGGQLGLSVLHVDAARGVAPEGNVSDSQTRYWRYPLWQKSTVIVNGRAPVGTNLSVRGAVWGSRFGQNIDQYDSIQYDTLGERQKDRDLTAGVRLVGTQHLPVGQLTFAVNGLRSRHHQTNVSNPGSAARTDSVSVYSQNVISTGVEFKSKLSRRLRVSAGVNLDGTMTPETGRFPPRDPFYAWGVTSGVHVELGGGWALRGTAGRKSRFPTMRELFGAALGKFVPNPGLKPVTAWIGEAGIDHRTEEGSFEMTAFLNRVYNTIDKRTFQEGPNVGKEQRINLMGARIYGVETTGTWRPWPRIRLDGSATWSRPRSLTQDGPTKLDEKPGLMGTGTVRVDLLNGLSVMGQVRGVDEVFARNEQNEFVSLPSSLIVDTRFSYDISRIMDEVRGELYVRGDNLLDDVRLIGLGLPGPGRRVRVGVTVIL